MVETMVDAFADLYPHLTRVVADQQDRVAWAKARARAIGASDAAKYSKIESVPSYIKAKLYAPFRGNDFTRHGNDREVPMLRAYNVDHNTLMFRSAGNPQHVATPDGIKLLATGELILAQCKTTVKPFNTIPLGYRRQCWWEQYVMGAERTLFIWEQHADYHPVDMEPESCWIDRDDDEIRKMIVIADLVLKGMRDADQFEQEMMEGTLK